jgi:cadmium resistance transport/sequestration family protein
MMDFLPTIFAAIAAFAASNIDDIFLLMLYFSQSNQGYTKRHIILGQYLGIGILVLLSLLGYFGAMLIPKEWIGLLGILPIILGIRQVLSKKEEEEIEWIEGVNTDRAGLVSAILSPQTYAIALVTFANGGDNISIYIPLFAAQNLFGLTLIILVFALMLALWLYLGYSLGKAPIVMKLLKQYGHIAVPFVLIGLGIFILYENESLSLVWSFFAPK